MFDYFLSIKDQFGLYTNILKFFFYFCVGAIVLFLIQKISKLFFFFIKKFNREMLLENIKKILSFFFFVIISIFIGWSIITFLGN